MANAPSIDLTRIEPDGSALVAGQAAPGAVVLLMSDGAEIASATADGNGNFVAMFTMPPGDAGRLLSFMAKMPDGSEVAGAGQIAVAAIAAPVVPAEAATPAAPAATPDTTTAALAITDDGVKVLQSGSDVPADMAANVSLDVIAYPSPGVVQFGGHGAAGSFVRIYLDNAPAGDASAIGADGKWTATLAGIEPKIFTLRVDQVDADGKVTSRFETPFKRETPEALAAATMVATTEPAAQTKVADVAAVAPAAEAAETAVAATAPETTAPAKTGAAGTAAADGTIADTTAATTGATAIPTATVEAATTESVATETPATDVNAAATGPESDAAVVADSTVVVEATAPATTTVPAVPATVTVTVQPGYTLWGIAQENFGSGVLYVQVFKANRDKIRDADLIYPGQVFTMPTGN